jgi:hypothetical protein
MLLCEPIDVPWAFNEWERTWKSMSLKKETSDGVGHSVESRGIILQDIAIEEISLE